MPIYEYRCQQGHTFEVMQRMSDDPVQTCETCEAPVARVFHPVAVHFKGKGFYNTDYGTRNRQRETAAAAEKSSSSSSGGESSPKADSGSGADSSDAKGGEKAAPKVAEKTAAKAKDAKAVPAKG
jgi:putative FmdB family regulatory protein